MRRMRGWMVVAAFLGVAGVVATGGGVKPAWTVRMDQLSELLGGLLLDVVSGARFWDPENRAHLLQQVHQLGDFSHDVAADPGTRHVDPSWAFLATHLRRDVHDVERALERGELGYGRALLLRVADACTACHARPDSGVRLPGIDVGPREALLTPWELPRFHAAVRRFDLALAEYRALLAGPSFAAERPREHERAQVMALVLAVRVKDQPRAALEIVDAVLGNGAVMAGVAERARAWRADILEWQTEVARAPSTAEELHAEAKRLVERAARDAARDGPIVKLVPYLRASAMLHAELALRPRSDRVQEALLLLGDCHVALRGFSDEMMELAFYEACIAHDPSTPAARACFDRYRSAVLHVQVSVDAWPAALDAPFSVRPDESLPADLARRLEHLLRLLAPAGPRLPDVPDVLPPLAP